jgi:hypothetical protein
MVIWNYLPAAPARHRRKPGRCAAQVIGSLAWQSCDAIGSHAGQRFGPPGVDVVHRPGELVREIPAGQVDIAAIRSGRVHALVGPKFGRIGAEFRLPAGSYPHPKMAAGADD